MVADTEPLRALVTGANGFIGSYLTDRLLQDGWQVRCLVRRSSDLTFLPQDRVELAYGDVTDAASLPPAVAGCAQVFHVAGWLRGSVADNYYRVNVGGTKNLLEACVSHAPGLQRFILVSSLSAHGPTSRDALAVEGDPDRPVSFYGQSKLQAEQETRTFGDRLSFCIVRPPPVYGPRERDMLQMFQIVAKGIRPSNVPDKQVSIIHVLDLVEGMMRAARQPQADGQTYYLANPQPVSWNETVATIAQAVNPKARELKIPNWVLKAAAYGGEVYSLITGREGMLNRQKLLELLPQYWTCNVGKAERELGFRAEVPLARGLSETAEWYRQQGWI